MDVEDSWIVQLKMTRAREPEHERTKNSENNLSTFRSEQENHFSRLFEELKESEKSQSTRALKYAGTVALI